MPCSSERSSEARQARSAPRAPCSRQRGGRAPRAAGGPKTQPGLSGSGTPVFMWTAGRTASSASAAVAAAAPASLSHASRDASVAWADKLCPVAGETRRGASETTTTRSTRLGDGHPTGAGVRVKAQPPGEEVVLERRRARARGGGGRWGRQAHDGRVGCSGMRGEGERLWHSDAGSSERSAELVSASAQPPCDRPRTEPREGDRRLLLGGGGHRRGVRVEPAVKTQRLLPGAELALAHGAHLEGEAAVLEQRVAVIEADDVLREPVVRVSSELGSACAEEAGLMNQSSSPVVKRRSSRGGEKTRGRGARDPRLDGKLEGHDAVGHYGGRAWQEGEGRGSLGDRWRRVRLGACRQSCGVRLRCRVEGRRKRACTGNRTRESRRWLCRTEDLCDCKQESKTNAESQRLERKTPTTSQRTDSPLPDLRPFPQRSSASLFFSFDQDNQYVLEEQQRQLRPPRRPHSAAGKGARNGTQLSCSARSGKEPHGKMLFPISSCSPERQLREWEDA